MARIQGIYYDGQSSKPNHVEVELTPNEIFFYGIADNDMGHLDATWYIEDLEDIDFTSSDTVHLKYGEFPFESLLIEDKEDAIYFRDYYPEIGEKNIYRGILSSNVFKMLGTSVFLLIGVTALYLMVVAPYIAGKAAELIPQNAEIKLGEKMTEHIFATMDFEEKKSETLNEFFKAVGFQSSYPINLHVEKSKVVNAFAVPGGKIVVYQGIIDNMETWEELAALLSHELAHVEQKHSLKAMCQNLSTYFVFSVMTGDVSGISAVLLEKSMMLKDLANSRSAEQEADEVGLQYLIDLNVDPQGIVDLFRGMQSAEITLQDLFDPSEEEKEDSTSEDIVKENGEFVSTDIEEADREEGEEEWNTGGLSRMLSTHPLTKDRISYLVEAVKKYENQEFPNNVLAKELFEELKSNVD
ncbi:MAG: Zn-dependent protease with chaperone function [Polaribacter sp.]|jgi:Zn-dependent protease with chaperone function